jgi:hypothetical protein
LKFDRIYYAEHPGLRATHLRAAWSDHDLTFNARMTAATVDACAPGPIGTTTPSISSSIDAAADVRCRTRTELNHAPMKGTRTLTALSGAANVSVLEGELEFRFGDRASFCHGCTGM